MSTGSNRWRVVWDRLTNPAFSGALMTAGVAVLVLGLTNHSGLWETVGYAVTGLGLLLLLAFLIPGRRPDEAGGGQPEGSTVSTGGGQPGGSTVGTSIGESYPGDVGAAAADDAELNKG